MLFLLFLIVDLYFSIPAGIAQFFNPTGEFAMPIGIPCKPFCASYLLNHFDLFLQGNNSLLHLYFHSKFLHYVFVSCIFSLKELYIHLVLLDVFN